MYHILAADIGGTHCRLAWFSADSECLQLQKRYTLPTAQVPHTDALLRAFAEHICFPDFSLAQADMLAVAIAGPLLDTQRARTSNAALEVDMREAHAHGLRGGGGTLLCNDFVAQAYACVSPAMKEAVLIVPGTAKTAKAGEGALVPRSIGVLGAGTGLGVAALHPSQEGTAGGYHAVASEAGHMPFAFCGGGQTDKKVERAYEDFLVQTLNIPYVTADVVLSGRGLCLLHLFFSGDRLDAATIAAQHLQSPTGSGTGSGTDTCHYFSTFLGRMCRQWVLMTLCSGGLYVTGGLAMKNPLLVHSEAFKAAFYDSQNFCEFLHSVPVFLNTNPDSGLWGAAQAGWQLLQQQSPSQTPPK